MPQNFLTCDREQSLLLPPDLRDWLDEDHLAWFVIEAIEELDLEPFYASYRQDRHGAADRGLSCSLSWPPARTMRARHSEGIRLCAGLDPRTSPAANLA